MSDNTVSPDTDDLVAFEKLFAGEATAPVEDNPKPEVNESEEEAFEEDSLAPTDNDDGETEDDLDGDSEPEPTPKKKSAQERINQAVRAQREAERREAALLAEIERLRTGEKPKETNTPTPPVAVPTDGPTPDDVDENGDLRYPLGEFDPKFIRDLTKHEFSALAAAQEASRRQAEVQAAEQATLQALSDTWQSKVSTAEDAYPDFREKTAALEDAFENMDEAHGEYLATTIMQMDNGTDVLYHLANNPDEARRIAAMSPLQATLTLGELQASFKDQAKPKPRVTSAPTPPPTRARGTGGKFSVPDDTDDLAAFEAKFYQK